MSSNFRLQMEYYETLNTERDSILDNICHLTYKYLMKSNLIGKVRTLKYGP